MLSDDSGIGIEVLGDVIDCPPDGPSPEGVQSKFRSEGNEFKVIGTLLSFDGVTVVVAGPSGDVSADLGRDFKLTGDLTPDTAVKMEGSVADSSMTAREVESACAGVGVIDCPAGVDPSLRLRVEGDTFDVTGFLSNFTSTIVQVDGPRGQVEAVVDAGTEINIDPASPSGTPVKVQGSIADDGSFLAGQIGDGCEAAAEVPAPAEEPAPAEPPADPAAAQVEDEVCNRGPGEAGEFRIEMDDDDEVEIKRGTVVAGSFDEDEMSLEVMDPSGTVSEVFMVMFNEAEVDGDLSLAEEVRVEGTLDGTTIQAEKVKALCPDAAHHGGDDDD